MGGGTPSDCIRFGRRLPDPVGYVSGLLPFVRPGRSKVAGRGKSGASKRGARVADFCTDTICTAINSKRDRFWSLNSRM